MDYTAFHYLMFIDTLINLYSVVVFGFYITKNGVCRCLGNKRKAFKDSVPYYIRVF